MEFNVQILDPSSIEWQNNILLINEKDFQFKNEKQTDKEIDNQIKTYSLLNASVIDNSIYDSSNKDSIFIGTSSYNINIKPINKEDKQKIISSFRKIINNNYSNDNDNENEINIKDKNNNLDEIFELISKKLSVVQNLLVGTINMSNDLEEIKEKNNEDKISEIKNNMGKILSQIDLTIINFYNYHNLLTKNKEIDYSFEEEQISSIIYGDNIQNNCKIYNSIRFHSNDLNRIGKNIIDANFSN